MSKKELEQRIHELEAQVAALSEDLKKIKTFYNQETIPRINALIIELGAMQRKRTFLERLEGFF